MRCATMPVHTAFVAGLLLFLVAGLGIAITIRRRRERIGPGMAGDASFIRLQRAQGNAVEHVPLLIVGLLLLELLGTSSSILAGIGAAIPIARASHAAGIILRTRHPLHTLGGALTYALEIVLACMLLTIAFRRHLT
jgi:uncharacterized protein